MCLIPAGFLPASFSLISVSNSSQEGWEVSKEAQSKVRPQQAQGREGDLGPLPSLLGRYADHKSYMPFDKDSKS